MKQIQLINSYGTVIIVNKVPQYSLFELIEESTEKILCCLTKGAMLEFMEGNITIFDSSNLPFNYKQIEEEMLTSTQNILKFINEK